MADELNRNDETNEPEEEVNALEDALFEQFIKQREQEDEQE